MLNVLKEHLKPIWFKPKAKEGYPVDNIPEFLLKPLDGFARAEFQAHVNRLIRKGIETDKAFAEFLLLECLTDWKGLIDSEGSEVSFSRSNIELLNDSIINALIDEILRRNYLMEDDKKKSS